MFFPYHQDQKTPLKRGWGGETTEPPFRCWTDFLKSVGYFFPFSWRRACLGRAVTPHMQECEDGAFASWVWRGVPCRTLVCSGCLLLLNIWWDFWELPWEHADDTKHQASKPLWMSEKISFSVCNFPNAFFCPCSFHNLGKIQQLGAHNTCFNMEEEVYISEWLDRYCVRTLCIVLAFSVSAEHPHYFIKLYTFFWFAKTHGKEEEILRSLWDFKVIWEE